MLSFIPLCGTAKFSLPGMPAKPIIINLLGQEDLKHTPQGRIIGWALTYGRYIMIGTEIVVLLAFIARFSLDRKLTDLKEEISQNQAILEANVDLENDIRTLQDHLAKVKQLTNAQGKPLGILATFQAALPSDVYVTTINISDNKLDAEVVAGTTGGFSQLLTNIQGNSDVTQLEIASIHKDPLTGISFKLSVFMKSK
ncbi:hypothetical protein A2973_01550 [Candidatus Gottesmanbacteria bacterium RIFCSPLOWO2_01_FULL_49_10]|uniref:Uncharacterized protein n=1 Tax=Candidatus Gottesmanbacteria bacterium RIFCSPLOWO2_01_FULL_49_10 TaxID=1798396 RepID=A0A1F6AWU1_9BACT|nr:MAG: hypothetical protein A2973_01550 [Candidatus Gottesmanbacteria bacterium RIFCSPLOWO2_01_FULL_49_10]